MGRKLRSIGRVARLAVLMLAFATLFVLLTPFWITIRDGYDHGQGETERASVVAAVLGALAGLAAEAFIHSDDR